MRVDGEDETQIQSTYTKKTMRRHRPQGASLRALRVLVDVEEYKRERERERERERGREWVGGEKAGDILKSSWSAGPRAFESRFTPRRAVLGSIEPRDRTTMHRGPGAPCMSLRRLDAPITPVVGLDRVCIAIQ